MKDESKTAKVSLTIINVFYKSTTTNSINYYLYISPLIPVEHKLYFLLHIIDFVTKGNTYLSIYPYIIALGKLKSATFIENSN